MQEGVKALLKSQAAELAGMTQAGLSASSKGGNPPPVGANGYPCKEFGEWIRKRALSDVGLASDGTAYDLKAEQARLNFHAANLKALEEAEQRGEMIPADVVTEAWQGILTNVRAKLLAMPCKLAAQAFAAHSMPEIEELLHRGIHEALTELSEDGTPKQNRKRSQ